MNSRERVLTALAVKQPDQVPFFDWVDDGIQKVLMGTEQLNEAEFARKIGFDAIQIKDYLAPVFTEQSLDDHVHNFVGDGLIKSEKDLDLMVFPDPYDEKFYDKAKQFMDQYGKEELAIYASLRAAMQHTIFSMGITTFSYGLYDNLKFVETVFDRFIDWNCVVAEKLQSLGVDFLLVNDDMAFNSGPMVSPHIFREIFLPKLKRLADVIKTPWAFHSDGNLMTVMDDLLSLGMNCINPIDPMSMNLREMKEKYGERICLWGNIDLAYTLTRGTPDEVEAEVKQRIKEAGPNGGYILASANSITDYCKPENVWAMAKAVKKYGKYPLNID